MFRRIQLFAILALLNLCWTAVSLADEPKAPPTAKEQPKKEDTAEAPKKEAPAKEAPAKEAAKKEAPEKEAPEKEEETKDESGFKSVKEKASYAIGLNVGRNLSGQLKRAGAELDFAILLRGFQDALDSKKPALNDKQMEAAMTAFDKEMQAGMALKAKEQAAKDKLLAEKNKKEGEAFLAENKKAKGVTTTDTGLQYSILAAGKGKTPKKSDVVRVHYHGTLPGGDVFDSSVDRGEPAEFEVGGVIPGWTEALLKMKVGDKWKLAVPADLAYGATRRGEKIGPNQVLLFDVELLEIVE